MTDLSGLADLVEKLRIATIHLEDLKFPINETALGGRRSEKERH